ncbi:MAG TPA: SAM-dependent methyltransferase, partial [Streptosporangiaceae bacterium]|nr:SAM-dependent methyltransferase [Streptosporangiaceae bacterium]
MSELPQFDTRVPNPARMWNYWLGGKDNFAADRDAAQGFIRVLPTMPAIARLARQFQAHAVHSLAADYGVRQFLDIGAGLPSVDNTHQVAQDVAPTARIVYVDHDPIVISHAQALLTSSEEGATGYILADLRDTDAILASAADTLDFDQPVAIMLLAILHLISDEEDPWEIIRRLMNAVPSGSYLMVSHGASDIQAQAGAELMRRYSELTKRPLFLRTHAEVARFLDGLPLIGPGVVPVSQWGAPGEEAETGMAAYCGIGRKPLSSVLRPKSASQVRHASLDPLLLPAVKATAVFVFETDVFVPDLLGYLA